MPEVRGTIAIAIRDAMKVLLTSKHLYQHEEIKTQDIETAISKKISNSFSPGRHFISADTLRAEELKKIQFCWFPLVLGQQPSNSTSEVFFALPPINTFCKCSDNPPPHNPVYGSHSGFSWQSVTQTFFLAYQCQQCQERLVHFMVHRERNKLTLAGRNPIEALPTPKFLPNDFKVYFSNARIAHNAGQTLSGLFQLRVFIEQFWRSLPAVKELTSKKPRASGEEIGEIYQSTLPVDFARQFPNLKTVYRKLSEAIHAANPDAALFEKSCEDVLEHFDARRIHKLK